METKKGAIYQKTLDFLEFGKKNVSRSILEFVKIETVSGFRRGHFIFPTCGDNPHICIIQDTSELADDFACHERNQKKEKTLSTELNNFLPNFYFDAIDYEMSSLISASAEWTILFVGDSIDGDKIFHDYWNYRWPYSKL